MNKYVCHPNGNDLNGGGFYATVGGTPTPPAWSDWHNNFAPTAIVSSCSIESWGASSVKIVSEGAFSASMVGSLVYCDFSDTYDDGRYVIATASSDYIGIGVAYSSSSPTVNVRVGGAILSPKEACALGNGDAGHEVLFPCNQTNQTINEVDGTAKQITMETEGATLNIYGVDEATGVTITSEDSNDWPVIKAKDESSWTTNTTMIYCSANLHYFKCDKIIFDGNGLVPRIVSFGSGTSSVVYLRWGDIVIQNSLESSESCGIFTLGYSKYSNDISYINNLKIYNCYSGIIQGTRSLVLINSLHIDNCYYGINCGIQSLATLLVSLANALITNCSIAGIYAQRYSFLLQNENRFSFYGNNVDIQYNVYSAPSNIKLVLRNCLFYNDSVGGKIIASTDNGTYVSVELINCILGNITDGSDTSRFSGIIPTLTNCSYIQADPTKDSANGDYRLNPAFADLSKIYDWTRQVNNIGATSIAEPVGGGGCFVQAGSGRFGVQES